MLSTKPVLRRLAAQVYRLAALAAALAVVGGGCRPSSAQSRDAELKNFYHKAWTLQDGLGAVSSVTQAPDGFIWLTTSRGVLRFDGVRFESVEEITNGQLRDSSIDSVFVSSSGGIWFTSRTRGLLLWKDNHVSVFPNRRCTPTMTLKTATTVEDPSGALWFRSSRGIFRLRDGRCEEVQTGATALQGQPHAILMDLKQTLWVKGASGKVLYLPRGETQFRENRYGAGKVGQFAFLKAAPDGSIWLSDDGGLRRITDDHNRHGTSLPSARSRNSKPAQFSNFTFANDGSLWAASQQGVHHFKDVKRYATDEPLNPADSEIFGVQQGLSSDAIWDLTVDKEGIIWLATSSGLDQLRKSLFSTVALPFGAAREFAVAAGNHDSVWVGSPTVPLTQVFKDGHIRTYRQTGSSIAVRRGPDGTIWSATWKSPKLWKLGKGSLSTVPLPRQDNDEAASDIAIDKNNDLWLTTFSPESYRRVGDDWTKVTALLGRKPGVIGAMSGDDAGNVWFAFSNKLVEWDGQAYQRYSYRDGTYNIGVNVISVHSNHVWMGGPGGVLLFSRGQFHELKCRNDTISAVTGIVETEMGELWLNGPGGISRIGPEEMAKWSNDPTYAVAGERFGAVDGLSGTVSERWPEPSAVRSGKLIWFASNNGVTFLNPLEFGKGRNNIPPRVYINSAVSENKTYSPSAPGPRLQSGRSLVLNYTALGFAAPERVFFRYKLEGLDVEWQNAGTRRQAFYTNLSPKKYVFRVLACNSDGVWNLVGDEYRFEILPTVYQTRWFWILCLLALALLVWASLALRIRSVSRAIRARAEERSIERARVARDLHDTLLQSVQGLILQFANAAKELPTDLRSRFLLESALCNADNVLLEGRNRVMNLREHDELDLFEALANVGKDLRWQPDINFNVQLEGMLVPLEIPVQEELYFIGREAITNSFRHAQASSIKVILHYDATIFRLSCIDDGVGLNSVVLRDGGISGHYGLIGMRERAQRIGAQYQQSSGSGVGTQIVVTLPARRAYGQSAIRRIVAFWKRIKG